MKSPLADLPSNFFFFSFAPSEITVSLEICIHYMEPSLHPAVSTGAITHFCARAVILPCASYLRPHAPFVIQHSQCCTPARHLCVLASSRYGIALLDLSDIVVVVPHSDQLAAASWSAVRAVSAQKLAFTCVTAGL